jgi:hypothetical protein
MSAQLAWFDRTGKPLGTVGDAGAAKSPSGISPDGNTVAYTRLDSQTGAGNI